ncbi:MAG: siroheme synthase [Planctomycetes bacterium GWA2_50_13]|uniref:precorrin-2 dehydrogenase/sirohydrochlorin ferrochelatase family protein n=1 Tax=Candidatus Avalokitesvara rifleensis TaxID=3367620 RepID=UPI0008BCED29|nr:bifunctional precorrin-2 dehydrogenase/sirohydrochlorin ferrochelatase [Candidatus Brocadiales bacterium]OHB38565.1 MAG: siroheme synthase [Planctomycetes bacterium GWA2_50_13]OHB94641.1 MAG: siroheme synthase [Planctomycetes bacterium RIFCSPLOWO2_02_FULL_50_16]OHC03643.1 MAG: siroheme synthase [Planctomycetes bacterium RIFCSPLOWO2_12_FULL_50_35]
MPRYYPIYLDIRDKKCVVVGGGDVAYRKAVSLKEAGAQVVVISPDFSKDFLKEEGITMLRQKYEERCLEGATLIIAATNDKEINQRVWEEARRHGLLVNVVDQPELCNFIVPSVVNRGELQISISTGGASPAFARRLRQELENHFGPEYGEFVELLSKMRSEARSQISDGTKRQKLMERLASPDMLDMIRTKGTRETEKEMRKIIGEETERNGY